MSGAVLLPKFLQSILKKKHWMESEFAKQPLAARAGKRFFCPVLACLCCCTAPCFPCAHTHTNTHTHTQACVCAACAPVSAGYCCFRERYKMYGAYLHFMEFTHPTNDKGWPRPHTCAICTLHKVDHPEPL
eukprot:1160398-Pelagomonas_calceolata.AAC.4